LKKNIGTLYTFYLNKSEAIIINQTNVLKGFNKKYLINIFMI